MINKKTAISLSLLTFFGITSLNAEEICNKEIVSKLLKNITNASGIVLEQNPSNILENYCEVFVSMGNKIERVFVDTKNEELIVGALFLKNDSNANTYVPSRLEKINKFSYNLNKQKKEKDIEILSNVEELTKFFNYSKISFSKENKEFVNKKYDILIFESLLCPYCKSLNKKLEEDFKESNVKLNKFYIPLNQDDYLNLSKNYYKNENELKEALSLKEKLSLQGVPSAIIRDSKTKEFVEIIEFPSAEDGYVRLKNFINVN